MEVELMKLQQCHCGAAPKLQKIKMTEDEQEEWGYVSTFWNQVVCICGEESLMTEDKESAITMWNEDRADDIWRIPTYKKESKE